VAHFWGAGLVWFSLDEAAARGLPYLAAKDGRALADLAATVALARSVVEQVPDDAWDRPTPCRDWDVRDLLNHMAGSAAMVTYGLVDRTIDASFYGDHVGDDPRGAFGRAADELLGVLRSSPMSLGATHLLPWAEMRGADLALMFAGDQLVHAWDLASSIGVAVEFDDGLVARIRAATDDYVDSHRGPGMFGEATTARPDASAIDRLAAHVGREVG
jgi:uncharacterized protein (TIGR03086 family)